MDEQLLETWRIHNRLLRVWLGAVSDSALQFAPQARERTVGGHFAHIHNNRLDWLAPAAPALAQGVGKIATGTAAKRAVLQQALAQSEEAVGLLVRQSLAAGGKMKAFKPHAVAFTGYLLVHEGYHLGKIDLLLRQAGEKLPDKEHYALWQWGQPPEA